MCALPALLFVDELSGVSVVRDDVTCPTAAHQELRGGSCASWGIVRAGAAHVAYAATTA